MAYGFFLHLANTSAVVTLLCDVIVGICLAVVDYILDRLGCGLSFFWTTLVSKRIPAPFVVVD